MEAPSHFSCSLDEPGNDTNCFVALISLCSCSYRKKFQFLKPKVQDIFSTCMIVQNFVFSPKIDPVCSLGHNDGCLLPLQGLGVVAVVVVEGGEEVEHGEEGGEGGEE